MQFRAKVDFPDRTHLRTGETVTVLREHGPWYDVAADDDVLDREYLIDIDNVERVNSGWEFVD